MKLPDLNNLINFKNLISVNRTFETQPDSQGHYLYLMIVFGLGLAVAVLLSFIVRRMSKSMRKFYRKIMYFLYFFSLVGLILVSSRYLSVPYLGSRFMVDLLTIVSLYWIFDILCYRYIGIPKEIRIKQEKEKFKKYLPKNYEKSLK
jgi:ABC-type polysaccharide transport system permease subunit